MNIIDEKYSNTMQFGGAASRRAGILRRILAAIMAAHQRQTERNLARFITRSGGRLTDAIEREMMQHQSARASSFGADESAKRDADDKPIAPLGWF